MNDHRTRSILLAVSAVLIVASACVAVWPVPTSRHMGREVTCAAPAFYAVPDGGHHFDHPEDDSYCQNKTIWRFGLAAGLFALSLTSFIVAMALPGNRRKPDGYPWLPPRAGAPMRKWLNDLNNFGRPFHYAAGLFATLVGASWLLRGGSTLWGAVLALITIGSGLTILVQTRREALDSPPPAEDE